MNDERKSVVTVSVFVLRNRVFSTTLNDCLEFGRQQKDEPAAYARVPGADGDRVVIANLDEVTVSRRHLRMKRVADDKVQLENLSDKSVVSLAAGRVLNPKETCVLDLPGLCQIGGKTVHLQAAFVDDMPLQSLRQPTLRPGQSDSEHFGQTIGQALSSIRFRPTEGVTEELLYSWLKYSMQVFQSAASSPDFLRTAAQAAGEMVDLDEVVVLLREEGDWATKVSHSRSGVPLPEEWRPSSTMLQRMLDERCTFFHVPRSDQVQSLIGVQSLVAAPILNSNGDVIGGLYGQRRLGTTTGSVRALTELEAKLFEVLACGVASGLARLEQERQLVAERVRFEQFFTPELARMLEAGGGEMLAAREAEVTILFCDIKGFSRISRASGPELAVEWVRDVLSALSDCVAEQQGVLVDYSGDSLEGLWGAPLATPQHATAACRAALQMRACLAELNVRWEERIGEKTDVSIGINSGRAQVGNIGSRRKFKYGAFGTTVNQASRVQGAAKQVGVSLLVTRSTVTLLSEEFPLRRLWTVKTVNIDEPVELFELVDGSDSRWFTLKAKYEKALSHFEQGQYYEAMSIVGGLVAEFPDDNPTRRLLQRTVNALGQPAGSIDAVWILDGK
jgi:adenylate cyclase